MSAIDTAWLDARITATKATIIKIEEAIDALLLGAQSYSLDTGQTRQTVTKASVGSLKNMLAEYENRLEALNNRRNGGAVVYVKPSW